MIYNPGYNTLGITLSEEEIQRPYVTNTDIWYNAEECVEIGLADAIKLY